MSKKIDVDRIENKALWKLMNDKGLFTALDLAKEIYDMFDWYGSGDKNTPSTSEDYIHHLSLSLQDSMFRLQGHSLIHFQKHLL